EALVTTREPSTDRTELFRPRRRHDPARVRRWLGYLAHVMTCPSDGSRSTRDFAWWRLARTTALFTTATRVWAGLMCGIMIGLVFGLVPGIMIGLVFGL